MPCSSTPTTNKNERLHQQPTDKPKSTDKPKFDNCIIRFNITVTASLENVAKTAAIGPLVDSGASCSATVTVEISIVAVKVLSRWNRKIEPMPKALENCQYW